MRSKFLIRQLLPSLNPRPVAFAAVFWARPPSHSSNYPLHKYSTHSSSVDNESSSPIEDGNPQKPIGDNHHATKCKPLRLMPLGGSITYGVGSSDKNGYRKLLHDSLTSDGYAIEMVGSRRSGTMINNQNEGWRGFTIDQIKRKACVSISLLLPNLVTINAGSNDCLQNLEIGQIGKRISRMLECVWQTSPGSTIILSTLLPNLDTVAEKRISQSNTQLQELAFQESIRHKRIILVDMHSADGPSHNDLVDGTHPNDKGYQKMADIWYKGIQEAVAKGFL